MKSIYIVSLLLLVAYAATAISTPVAEAKAKSGSFRATLILNHTKSVKHTKTYIRHGRVLRHR